MKLFNVCAIFLSILGCFSLSGMELDAPFSKSSLFSSSVSRGPEITPPLIHPQETQYQPNDEIIKHIVNKDMDYFAHNKDAMITSLNYFLHNARRDEDNEKKAITILNILQNQSQCEKNCQDIINQAINVIQTTKESVSHYYSTILRETSWLLPDKLSEIKKKIEHINLLVKMSQSDKKIIGNSYNGISEAIHLIGTSELPFKQQKKSLDDLSEALQNIKPLIVNNQNEFVVWLRKETEIKKALSNVGKKQIESDVDKYQPKSDRKLLELLESRLPGMSSHAMQANLDDLLNRTMILTEADIQGFANQKLLTEEDIKNKEYEKFSHSCVQLINDLQKLRQWQKPSDLKVLKINLIDSLDGIVAFIHKYDPVMQKDQEYQSYRIWLLMLIKGSIIANNDFVQEMINDWKIELGAIQKATVQSMEGESMQSSRLVVDEAIKLARDTRATKKTKQSKTMSRKSPQLSPAQESEKEKLKKEISDLGGKLKNNVFDIKKLSNYLTQLKSYKKLLQFDEQKEEARITKLINITANKIKKLTIIAPHQKTWQEKFEKDIKNMSADIEKKTVEELKNTIKILKERLPLDIYYDATKVLTVNSPLYLLTLSTLAQYIKAYNEKARLIDSNTPIEITHFRALANEIQDIQYLVSLSPSNSNMEGIIQSFIERLAGDVELLIIQAKNSLSLFKLLNNKSSKIKLIETYLGNDEILKPSYNDTVRHLNEYYDKEEKEQRIKEAELPKVEQKLQKELPTVNIPVETVQPQVPVSVSPSSNVPQAAPTSITPQEPTAKQIPVEPVKPTQTPVSVQSQIGPEDKSPTSVVQSPKGQPVVQQSVIETYFVQPMSNLWQGIRNAFSNFFSWYTAKDRG